MSYRIEKRLKLAHALEEEARSLNMPWKALTMMDEPLGLVELAQADVPKRKWESAAYHARANLVAWRAQLEAVSDAN